MTASMVQASCTMDAVVCDDTGTMLTPMWIAPLGVAVLFLFLVLVAVAFAFAPRRRR
jgi:hypothetical protein